MSDELLISLDQVDFAYEETPILRNVSFTVAPGEFIGIIGPNGGGKTTLLRLLMGFLKPTRGSIRLFGTTPKTARPRIAYVPQVLSFDRQFPIPVMDLVLTGRLSKRPWYRRYSDQDRTAAEAALARVGLSHCAPRPFGTLSGGEAQRALIARALASEPELLLLDEPTANIDAQAEAEIYKLIRSLKSKITIVMVTHNIRSIVGEMARILCVQNSVELLTPAQICQHMALGVYHAPLGPT